MSEEITTTITVQFGEAAASPGISAEIDGRPDGLNGGRSRFYPGDVVYFLVYRPDGVKLDQPTASAGSVYPAPAQNVKVEETVRFTNGRTARLSKPASGSVSVKWMGMSLGSAALGADQMTLTASQSGVAVAKVSYTSKASAYRLAAPSSVGGETSFEILVVITGRTA